MSLPHHELADCYPDHDEPAINLLVSSMKRSGFHKYSPIVTYRGAILDGRGRHKAALQAGVDPIFREYEDGEFESIAEFVESVNGARRDLSKGQKAVAAGKIAAWVVKQNEQTLNGMTTGRTVEKVAATTGLSPSTVARAQKVVEEGTPELVEAVRQDEIGVAEAAVIAAQPQSQQNTVLEQSLAAKKKKKSKPREVMRDCLGRVIPDRLRDIFAITWIARAIEQLRPLETQFRSGMEWSPYLGDGRDKGLRACQLLKETLEANKPYSVCDDCDGDGCSLCRQSGWRPEWAEQTANG